MVIILWGRLLKQKSKPVFKIMFDGRGVVAKERKMEMEEQDGSQSQ